MNASKPVKSKVTDCRFWTDPEVPPDHLGRLRCRRCGLMGKPGDQHHPTDFDASELPPVHPDDRSAEITGERNDS